MVEEVNMALNIKNTDVEKLLNDVVQITGESKTEAVRRALEERYQRRSIRFGANLKAARLQAFLEDEVWTRIPDELRGISLAKAEEERILGYRDDGV